MLRLAARRHPDDRDLSRRARSSRHALQELRELARGIHPAVLTERGLEPAVRALADRAPVPVELASASTTPARGRRGRRLLRRLRGADQRRQVRRGASVVRVAIDARTARARIAVSDDGAGGADPAGGSGLRGLADRVEALGGRLTIDSPPGAGTTVRADIPNLEGQSL